MAKLKVTLTGTSEKAPNINTNGNVDLLLKSTMSVGVPKGLSVLKDAHCLVRVAPKTWKKVKDKYKIDSKLLITGEASVGINAKGTPYIEVITFDIGLIEDKVKESKTEIKDQPIRLIEDKVKEPKTETKDQPVDKEIDPAPVLVVNNINDIKELPLKDIIVPKECLELKINPVKLQELIESISRKQQLDKAITVNEKYVLVDGYRRYLAAKQLGMEIVPIRFSETKIDKPNFVSSPASKKTNTKPLIKKPQDNDKINKPITVSWVSTQDKTQINTKDIILTESVHLESKCITILGGLKKLSDIEKLAPVVIRPLEDGKYSLVTGIKSYFAAKIMDIPMVYAVLTDLSHDEFMKERGWIEGKR